MKRILLCFLGIIFCSCVFNMEIKATTITPIVEEQTIEDKEESIEQFEQVSIKFVTKDDKDCNVNNKEIKKINKEVQREYKKELEEARENYSLDMVELPLEMFDLVNKTREDNNLLPLVWDELLVECAITRANELSLVFSHTRPNGEEWWTINDSVMYGENIAQKIMVSNDVLSAWLKNDMHKQNLLDPNFKTCGIALFVDDNGIYYWVQEFGY